MSQGPSFSLKALLVGSGPHLSSARVMIVEAGFVIAEEITHPGIAIVVLDKLKTDTNIDVSIVVFVLSDAYRDSEEISIRQLRVEYPDCTILCVAPIDDIDRAGRLTPIVTRYIGMYEGWVASLYTQLVELRKEIETS